MLAEADANSVFLFFLHDQRFCLGRCRRRCSLFLYLPKDTVKEEDDEEGRRKGRRQRIREKKSNKTKNKGEEKEEDEEEGRRRRK